MKHFNRAAAILVCLFIIAAPFTRCFYSYADNTTDNWENVTTNEELVEAFRYYCKSRDLTIEGSVADVVTSYTTYTFNNLCNGLGIDVTALQAHLKKETDGSNIRYLFDSTGITAYNAIFAQFLQDNELQVGDSIPQNDPETLYSGQIITDHDHYFGLVYVWSGNDNTWGNIDEMGTTYKYSSQSIISLVGSYTYPPTPASSSTQTISPVVNLSFNLPISNSVNLKARFLNGNANNFLCGYQVYSSSPGRDNLVYGGEYTKYDYSGTGPYKAYNTYIGNVAIGYNPSLSYPYSIGLFQKRDDGSVKYDDIISLIFTSGNQPQPASVFIYAPTINNNNYEGDTIINDDGTPENDQPSGGTPPNWDLGGGEGTADDGNGNTWNITWPSFELPDLNIDWSINGLSEKFPFSIPFDLVSLVTVLSAEPEAPQFTGTVDLKVYQWNYDLDFTQFNTVAAVFRTAETLLFVFGLIMITRKIIRG